MSFYTPENIIRDADGFTPPLAGGSVAVKYGSLTYENVAASKAELFTLPEGAVIVGWQVNVTEAFNDASTDVLDIGDGTTADRFADGLDVSAAGQIVTGFDVSELHTALTAPTTFYGTYIGANPTGEDTADAGAATVTVFYITQ